MPPPKLLPKSDADKLDSLADMHIQSGDPETGEAMKKTAKRIRGEGQTPAAKPRNQERPSEGEFWMNPDGDLERAEDGHQNFAHDKRVAGGEKPSENETPFKDYEYLRSRGWTRVFVSRYGGMGRIYFSGDISNSQLSELRNVAIEHEMELVRETPSGKGAILWSPLDDAPAARPRKRNESVFQDKFFLPGEATQKPSGSTQAVPISGESPTVPPEDRTSAEAAGALPRLTGEQLRGKAATWIETGMDKVSKDLASGKRSEPPSFKEFEDYMKGQQPEIKPGQISEMWHEEIGQAWTTPPEKSWAIW